MEVARRVDVGARAFDIHCTLGGASMTDLGSVDINFVFVLTYKQRVVVGIFAEAVDTGATPFIILCIYGVCAIIFIAILDIHENHRKPKRPAEKYTLRRSSPPGTGFHSSHTREDFPIQKNSRLERVRKNITVDYEVFHQYGIIFKWNLIDEDGNLQLNYEVSNTKSLASKIDKDTDLTIKANVYDDRGNLLCIEESWLEYRQIRRGYAADYFYFSGRSIRRAASIKIYAIDPTEEYDDE